MSKNSSHRRGARSSRASQFTPYPEGGEEAQTPTHRQPRLEKILLEEIGTLLRGEARDPALAAVRPLSVELSSDGRHARVAYVVTAPIEDERIAARTSREALARATGFLRARLADLLDLKRLPKLAFAFVGVRAPGPGVEKGGEPWSE